MNTILKTTPKQLKRIAAIHSAEQVTRMSSQSIKVLTNDFEEQIVRMIIARIPTADKQLQGLNHIKKAFDSLYLIEEAFVLVATTTVACLLTLTILAST